MANDINGSDNLGARIQSGDYDNNINGKESYDTPFARVTIQNPEIAKTVLNIDSQPAQADATTTLNLEPIITEPFRSGDIYMGENTVSQQPEHNESNPKYKSMGGSNPSLPRDPRQSFNDKDYRNPQIRTISDYGPTTNSSHMTNSLGEMDEISKILRSESTPEITKPEIITPAVLPSEKENTELGQSEKALKLAEEKIASLEAANKELGERVSKLEEQLQKNNDLLEGEIEQAKKTNELLQQLLNQKTTPHIDDTDPNTTLTVVPNNIIDITNPDSRLAIRPITGIAPIETPPPVPETPPPVPELVRIPEAEDPNRRRNLTRASIIAGVVAGGIGLLGGAQVASVGILVCASTGVLGWGVGLIGKRQINSLESQINSTQDIVLREKLIKRQENWKKVTKITDYVKAIAKGAGTGFAISGAISNLFMGGHGLAWNRPESSSFLNPTSNPESGLGRQQAGPTGGTEGVNPESTFDSGLIKDGRVVLPGDPSNGNLATGPIGNLPGGEMNPNNFSGGQSDLGWWKLGKYLNANHISVSDLQAAGGDIHRMGYALQENPSLSLSELLNRFGGESVLNANASLGR